MSVGRRVRFVVLVAIGGIASTWVGVCDRGWAATPSQCEVPAGTSRSDGSAPAGTVTLTSNQKKLTFKFDADRGEATRDVTIRAQPALTGTAATEIEITTSPLVRDDQHATFSRPKVTPPTISRDGERITFTVCASARGAQAGSYSGSLLVEGPTNVAGTTVDITATTRSRNFFFGGLIVAVIAAAVGLTLKGIADYRREITGKKDEAGKPVTFDWPDAVGYIWAPKEFRVGFSIIGILIAAVAAATVYNKTPTWGSDWFADGVSLAATAIAAVGAQGVLDGLRGAPPTPKPGE